MSSLAAEATECFLGGQGTIEREINPSKEKKCSVRLHGDLVVRYILRAVGGPTIPKLLHEEAPRKFDKVFDIFDPDTFFLSYTACRDAFHQMLMQTPLLREFDLAADNWDNFMPHNLATLNVVASRRLMEEHGGVPLRFNLDISLTVWVKITYSEPKALLLACKEASATAPCQFTTTVPAECCVCMEELTTKDNDDTVRLPCSHSLHRGCIMPWFYKVATCPMCRHDISKYLIAVTNTPKGKFPGLGL